MEVEEIVERWGPWPWLLFKHGADSRIMTVFSTSNDDETRISSVPELEKKSVRNCCHGWLVLSVRDHFSIEFSLWDPVSRVSISLPRLEDSSAGINACILSSDPSSLSSTLYLFYNDAKIILFCRINGDDRQWIRQCYEKEIHDMTVGKYKGDYLHSPIACNDKLYCLTSKELILVRIEIVEKDFLRIQPLIQLPCLLKQSLQRLTTRQIIESRGDIFTVSIVFENRELTAKFGNEIIGVEVHKLNFSSKAWERTESVGDQAFFSCDGGLAFSCSASLSGLSGNHLYFTRREDLHLYSYDIEEGLLSVRLLCPDSQTSWMSLKWIMPHIRSTNLFGKALSINEKEQNRDEKMMEAREKDDYKSNPRTRLNIHLDILKYISHKLNFFSYKNFSAVSTNWRKAAPPFEINRCSFKSPWLLYFQKNKGVFKIVGPKRSDKYLFQVPESLRDATLCHCRDDWLLMCKYAGEQPRQLTVNFVNPFTKVIIRYPDLVLEYLSSSRFSFSSSPTSSSCVVIVVTLSVSGHGCLNICSSREERWKRFELGGYAGTESFCNNQIFINGAFYFMSHYRELGVLTLEGQRWYLNLHHETKRGYLSQYQGFLAECNGEIISVFISDTGKWMGFKLNNSTFLWDKFTSLGNYTMYISRMSSLLTIAETPEMADKIYFPSFDGNGMIVSLCLRTGKYCSSSSEGLSKNWYGTREQLRGCWIRPN